MTENADNLTKAILVLIAIALWMIALDPWLRPEQAPGLLRQESSQLGDIRDSVRSINRKLELIERDTESISTNVVGIQANTAPHIQPPRR